MRTKVVTTRPDNPQQSPYLPKIRIRYNGCEVSSHATARTSGMLLTACTCFDPINAFHLSTVPLNTVPGNSYSILELFHQRLQMSETFRVPEPSPAFQGFRRAIRRPPAIVHIR